MSLSSNRIRKIRQMKRIPFRVLASVLAVLCLALPAGSLWSQSQSPVAIESRIDKATITIGDTVRYSVRTTRNPDVEIEWPGLAANLGAFEIRDYHQSDPRQENDRIIEEISYTISTFDTGRFVIPPLTIEYRVPPDTNWRDLSSEKLEIYVKSILPSEAGDIRDLKTPWELPKDWSRVILISSIAAGVLLLVAIGYYWWRRRQGKGLLPLRAEPPRPAHEVALEALQKLRESDLLQRGEIKLYYVTLSDIVRRYIEGRYTIVALEMTTPELLEHLNQADLDPECHNMVHELLEESDLVKFAKFAPADNEHYRLLNLAESFVEATKVVPAPEETNGKAEIQEGQPASAEAAPVAVEGS